MITITNSKVYRSELPISEYENYDNIDIVEDSQLLMYLTEEVQLSESLKFKRLFEIIGTDSDIYNLFFHSSLGGHPIEPYLQEIQNVPTEKVGTEFLEVYWSCEDYDGDITIVPSFHGLGREGRDMISYALDFSPLNNLQNLVLKIDPTLVMYKYGKGKITHKQIGNMAFSVFDLFHTILYEISFHGGPNDKKERFEELDDRIKEAEEEMMDENTVEYKDFHKMIKEMESKDKFLVKYKDLRERVNEALADGNDIDKLKNCLREKLKIYYEIINADPKTDFTVFYKRLTDIEFNMQTLYGLVENINEHKFWSTPRCTCPKIDNVEIYPSDTPVFDKNCPIHKK